jgi:hypothetical protein
MTTTSLLPTGRSLVAGLSQARREGALALHGSIVAFALLCWALALHNTTVSHMNDFGLVSVLPPTYELALTLLIGGFVLAISQSTAPSTTVMVLYLAALILVIHGTAPELYSVPRYAWTYKHLAVADLIARQGVVDRNIDIYNNWPGFFAAAAWLQRLAGDSLLDAARWAMVFFSAVTVAAVRFAVGGLTRSARVAWLATGLFLLGSWVGTEYFSPQALAFVFAFAFVGVVLRATAPRRAPARIAAWVARPTGDPLADATLHEPVDRMPAAQATVVGGVLWLAIVVTHQLTPVLILAAVGGLFVVRRIPLRLIAVMAVVELVWVALGWKYLHSHFAVVNAPGLKTPTPQGSIAPHAQTAVAWAADGSRIVVAVLALLAAGGVLESLRRRRVDMTSIVLIVAPALVVPLQAYGGEGIFRAYIFALPWMAVLGARVLVRPAEPWRRICRLTPTVMVVTAGFLFAYFGLERANYVSRDDVSTARFFETRLATPSTQMLLVAPNFPGPLTANYAADHIPPADSTDAVLSLYEPFRTLHSATTGARELAQFSASSRQRSVYVILSGSQTRYADLYGLYRPGFLTALHHALNQSRFFRVVYRTPDSAIYRYVGPRYYPKAD